MPLSVNTVFDFPIFIVKLLLFFSCIRKECSKICMNNELCKRQCFRIVKSINTVET